MENIGWIISLLLVVIVAYLYIMWRETKIKAYYEDVIKNQNTRITWLKSTVRIVPVMRFSQSTSTRKRKYFLIQRIFDGSYLDLHGNWVPIQEHAYGHNVRQDVYIAAQQHSLTVVNF